MLVSKRLPTLPHFRKSTSSRLHTVSTSIIYRLFNPQVPVVICSKHGKEVAAMPANSCSSISDSPPLVSVSVRRGLRTNRIIQSSSSFSINWLSFEPKRSRNVILDLANPQVEREIEDKLKEHDVPYSILEGVPVLNYACAFLRCRRS
jgi:flavin reductase (DIM6/NTAB) family NADH-FMN oxidoreductase RutF